MKMQKHTGSFDLILDAVADHEDSTYLHLLARHGPSPSSARQRSPSPSLHLAFSLDGAAFPDRPLVASRKPRRCSTSAVTSATADVEVVPIQKVNEAYERLLSST